MNELLKKLKSGARILPNTCRRTVHAVKHIREDPAVYVQDLLFGLTLAVIILNFAVSFLLFTIQGGYTGQIAAIWGGASGGLNAASKLGDHMFELFRSGVLWNITWALMAAQFFYLLIVLFWKGGLAHRIILTADLIFTLILGLCAAVYQGLNRRIIHLSQEQEARIVELFHRSGQTIINVFFVLCVAAAVCLIILALLKTEGRTALKDITLSFVISYLVCPFILILIGNIIPLACSIVLMLIIVGVFYLILSGFADGGSSGGGGNKSKAPEKPASDNRPSWKIPPGIQVHKVHGLTHDYVERRNSLDGFSRVCSLYDLRKGKFVIYDSKGNQLSEKDIPWKPKNK